MTDLAHDRIESALRTVLDRLTECMNPEGFWEGELSSSALSTATAVSALAVSGVPDDIDLIQRGVSWLARTQNADGGWGDTIESPSNLSTILLVTAALKLAAAETVYAEILKRSQSYITRRAGTTEIEMIEAVERIYGDDRTFAVPILANCALAGMMSWDHIPALPFELAVFPRKLYRLLRLQVVSYALPALIAIGLAIHHHALVRCPLRRLGRRMSVKAVLTKLKVIQPESGGFLEATPLTSFVAMSLASVYGPGHPVVSKSLEFIRHSQRSDGSWPIDSNLSVWLTTGAVSALTTAGKLDSIDTHRTRRWLAAQQYHKVHPFTGASPGGFAWTHLSGGVPDADDTSGAVLACLRLQDRKTTASAVKWILDLQNADGGWPAFCRGWGQLPFDKSSPDITAHAIRALQAFDIHGHNNRCCRATKRGFRYLARAQQSDGSWIPLWFGNQAADDQSNRVFGTSRSLLAYADCNSCGTEPGKGVQYLLSVQNPDGGWGGGQGIPSSMEETALALTALYRFDGLYDSQPSISRGTNYLLSRVEDGSWTQSTPIGLYFSSLWYSEKLYPVIWTAEALGLAANRLTGCKNRSDYNVCITES